MSCIFFVHKTRDAKSIICVFFLQGGAIIVHCTSLINVMKYLLKFILQNISLCQCYLFPKCISSIGCCFLRFCFARCNAQYMWAEMFLESKVLPTNEHLGSVKHHEARVNKSALWLSKKKTNNCAKDNFASVLFCISATKNFFQIV